jgi:phosphopentomutase
MNAKRAFVLVIDALGVGAMPDAPAYGDALTANTLGNIDASVEQLHLPNMERLGFGHLLPLRHLKALPTVTGCYGKMAEASPGKDTTTGHWEMMGVVLEEPFPTYPDGFPAHLIEAFMAQAGVGGVLGNKAASGTKILDELGEEHLKTGWPILYTSADSVWQLATHTDVTPLETLYKWCELSRELLRGEHEVSRVIARPFTGSVGQFKRLGSARHDYAVMPPEDTVLSRVKNAGGNVVGVGKISDIFCGAGLTHHHKTVDNLDGLAQTLGLINGSLQPKPIHAETPNKPNSDKPTFVFINLVETDMNFGHRRDVAGYAKALEQIDVHLEGLLNALQPDDLLILTGDHGCDPTAPGSDHTREFVPLVFTGKGLAARNVGTRSSFADLGQTVLHWLGISGEGLTGTSALLV